MAKQSGLGDNFYIGGYDLSGNVSSLDQASGGPALLDVTPINVSANTRIGGLRDGDLQFTSFFDPSVEHPALSTLPRTDVIASYLRGNATGNPAACIYGRQLNYDPTRDTSGNLTLKVEVQGDGYGLHWGTQLTPGIYTTSNSLTGQNTGFEGGIGTWVTGLNSPTLADSSAKAHTGSDSMSVTSTTAGTMAAKHVSSGTGGIAVTPGRQCYVQAWFLAGSTARTCQVAINWYNSSGTLLTTSANAGVADNTSTWTVSNTLATAPASAAFATVIIQVTGVAGSGEVHYVDDVELILLPAALDTGIGPLFTGNSSTFEGGIANWAATTNCTIAQSTAEAHTGTHSLSLTSTAAGAMAAQGCAAASILTGGFAVTGGEVYYAGAWFWAASTTETVQVGIAWYDVNGNALSTAYGTGVTDSSTAWTLASALLTAPAAAAWATVSVTADSTSAGSEVHYVDDVVCYPACGASAYLQVLAFTGTDCTIEIQDSADGITFANVSGMAFAQVTSAPGAQRIAIANGTNLRRYVQASVISTGGFTALSFDVVVMKNVVPVSF